MAFKMKGYNYPGKSPLHQEGPVDKKQVKLQKSEMDGTYVYDPKEDKDSPKFAHQERINDLEDRIEFLNSDMEGGATEQQKKDKAKLQQELAILRKRGPGN